MNLQDRHLVQLLFGNRFDCPFVVVRCVLQAESNVREGHHRNIKTKRTRAPRKLHQDPDRRCLRVNDDGRQGTLLVGVGGRSVNQSHKSKNLALAL